MNKNIGILASWSFIKIGDSYYCPSTHYVYLKEVSKLYKHIYMLSTCSLSETFPKNSIYIDIKNITVIKLPVAKSYLDAQKYKREYRKAILSVESLVDVFYCRIPDPFCWLPSKISKKPVIMHFVGDTVDVTKHNVQWSWLKKKIMIMGFYPELVKIRKAAKKAVKVCANGIHIARKLERHNIVVHSVVSSTITEQDCVKALPNLEVKPFRLIYVGYLRYAKGIDTLINVIKLLSETEINYTFDIVGDGDMFKKLNDFVLGNELSEKVKLHGRVDDRQKLFNLLQRSHLFFFPSLSEGSPRVVIEAMSQGVAVLSTPVGSLPTTFLENKEIYYFPFNDANRALAQIVRILKNKTETKIVRENALRRVKHEFTIDKFIKKVYTI